MLNWRPRSTTTRIIIHDTHTGSEVKDIQSYLEVRGRVMGLLDIGYHFLIDRDGKIVECRPDHTIGSHCPGSNHDSIGVALVGGPGRLFPDYQINVAGHLVHFLRQAYGRLEVIGHTEIQRFKDRKRQCPCIDMDAFRLITDPELLMETYPMPTPQTATGLTTQNKLVLEYLSAGHTLTNMVALTALGVGSLSSRIAELRKLGYEIEGRRETDRFDRSYMKYDLVTMTPASPFLGDRHELGVYGG